MRCLGLGSAFQHLVLLIVDSLSDLSQIYTNVCLIFLKSIQMSLWKRFI